jgi:D-xylose transport system substrate-binding protein
MPDERDLHCKQERLVFDRRTREQTEMTGETWEQFAKVNRRQFVQGGTAGFLAFTAGIRTAYSDSGKAIRAGFILPDYNQLRWKNADKVGFETEAKKLGLICHSEASQDLVAIQTSQVENMLTQGIDVLVLTPVNVTAAVAMVRKANAASVPVISYNDMCANSDVDGFVARDGVLMAEAMAAAAIKDRPTGNYVLVFGDQGTTIAHDVFEGFMNVLQPQIASGAIKIISQQYNKDFSPDLARAQVENALTKVKNNVSAVLCGNDGMAYGAIQALQAQGLAGKVFVCGADAEPRAQQLVKEGLLTLTSFTDFMQQGIEAARAAQTLGLGKKIETGVSRNNGLKEVPWVKVVFFNVTKDNLVQCTKDYPWWFDKRKLSL